MLVFLLALSLAAYPDPAYPDPAYPDPAPSSESAAALVHSVDAGIAKLPGLRYSVVRKTERNGTIIEDHWRIVQFGTMFRIDYFGDTARQITFDGKKLTDYVPANGKAVRFDLLRMADVERAKLLGQVLGRVAIPGMRLGEANATYGIAEEGLWEGRGAVTVVGTVGEEVRLRYVIDRERSTVLHSEILDHGRALLQTDATDQREIAPGTWISHEVTARSPDAGGDVRVTYTLTKVAILLDTPADAFDAHLDPSIPVEERP